MQLHINVALSACVNFRGSKRMSSQNAEIENLHQKNKILQGLAQTLLRFLGSDQNFSFQNP